MHRQNKSIRRLLLSAILCGATASMAQSWTTQKSSDGKVEVRYLVTSPEDSTGNGHPLVRFRATMTESVDFRSCLAAIRDVSNHKEIDDDASSRVVETVSDHEWIVYYDLKMPWPLPKTDCVARMVLSEDSANRTARFDIAAAPDKVKPLRPRRIRVYEISYVLKDLGNGRVQISSAGKSAPPFDIPMWMIRAGFPGSAADPLERIVQIARRHPAPPR